MKIFQINTTVNTGSTGRIAEDLGQKLLLNNNESYIAFGRKDNDSESKKIKIGTQKDFFIHILLTRLLDKHGLGSKKATQKLTNEIEAVQPDIIHLHNVHGYYLHLPTLFDFLQSVHKPIVWTLHDCWAFTGHCAHFEDIGCIKWKTHCFECPKTKRYPASFFIDNSYENYSRKKNLFTNLPIHIVTPSKWLKNLVQESFLNIYPTSVINNGIDLKVFRPDVENILPNEEIKGKKIILGVANIWQINKGLNDFIELSKILTDDFKIVLIGLTTTQIKELPKNILGICRTESVIELATWYAISSVFVNPSWSDNFPTTNLEALACGTPVITYRTGGSPEAISEETGFVVDNGNIQGIRDAIKEIQNRGEDWYKNSCRKRAELLFNKEDRFQDYLDLYEKLLLK